MVIAYYGSMSLSIEVEQAVLSPYKADFWDCTRSLRVQNHSLCAPIRVSGLEIRWSIAIAHSCLSKGMTSPGIAGQH